MSALEYTLTRSFPLRIFANLMQSEMARHTINRGIPPTALAKSHTYEQQYKTPRLINIAESYSFFQLSAQTDRLSLRSRKCVFYTLSESEKSSFSCATVF